MHGSPEIELTSRQRTRRRSKTTISERREWRRSSGAKRCWKPERADQETAIAQLKGVYAVQQHAVAEVRRQIADRSRLDAEKKARRATAFGLAAQSKSLERSPQLSLLLGIRALEITQRHHEARAPLAEQALRKSLVLTGGQGLPIRAGGGSQAEFSSDNHWLVTVGNHRVGFDPEHVNNHETITVYSDNVAYLWDLRKAHPEARSPRVLRSSNLFGSIRISPDGRR